MRALCSRGAVTCGSLWPCLILHEYIAEFPSPQRAWEDAQAQDAFEWHLQLQEAECDEPEESDCEEDDWTSSYYDCDSS